MKMPLFWKIVLWLVIFGLLCYAALVGWVYYQEVTVPEPQDYDGILVLGAQVNPNGEPSVQLGWRLDLAKEYYDKKHCPIVCCGGQGGTEPAPEGEVMVSVLLAQGVPEEDLIAETESQNTRQNLVNGWKLLQERGCQKPLIITSDYHLPRALALGRDLGLDPEGAGSPCRNELIYWMKNHCREAIAWMKYWAECLIGREI